MPLPRGIPEKVVSLYRVLTLSDLGREHLYFLETMTISRDTKVDLDRLVRDMLEAGPDEVSRPSRLPQHDFECIRDIIRRVIRMYHPAELDVPWQPGPRSMSGVTLMALIKSRDYQAADDYLVVEGSFLPA